MTLSPPLEFDVSGVHVGSAIRLLTAATLMHTRHLIDHAIASASSHYLQVLHVTYIPTHYMTVCIVLFTCESGGITVTIAQSPKITYTTTHTK